MERCRWVKRCSIYISMEATVRPQELAAGVDNTTTSGLFTGNLPTPLSTEIRTPNFWTPQFRTPHFRTPHFRTRSCTSKSSAVTSTTPLPPQHPLDKIRTHSKFRTCPSTNQDKLQDTLNQDTAPLCPTVVSVPLSTSGELELSNGSDSPSEPRRPFVKDLQSSSGLKLVGEEI